MSARPGFPSVHSPVDQGARAETGHRVGMDTSIRFADRAEAGQQLAGQLRALADDQPVVMGLPRGGLPVAREVASALDAPLDVVVVRKIGAPGHREFALGAIGEGDVEVLDHRTMERLGIDRGQLLHVIDQEWAELGRRQRRYRTGRDTVDVTGRTVVVVDDGIATGRTARAAAQVLRARDAHRVVLAAPVAAPRAVEELRAVYDDVVVIQAPPDFAAVGSWYVDFGETTDEDVVAILAEQRGGAVDTGDRVEFPVSHEVTVSTDGVALPGELVVPQRPDGLVIFAHGSGSSRHSPRNQQVATHLHAGGMATLLLDLLTESEDAERSNVFDIDLLAQRVAGAIDWSRDRSDVGDAPIGLFGASTGAAAALEAAVARPDAVQAVVSRGGRVDLAPSAARVRAPVLLIVGGDDTQVLELNQQTAAALTTTHRLEVIPGAGHLFQGPGELEAVAAQAVGWFRDHLAT